MVRSNTLLRGHRRLASLITVPAVVASFLTIVLTGNPASAAPTCTTDCYVNAASGNDANDGATPGTALQHIQNAVSAVSPFGNIHVASGTYDEDVSLTKPLVLQGAGADTTTIRGPIGGPTSTVTITASGVKVDGFTITRAGNNPADWINAGLNSAGISIQSQAFSADEISHNKLTGNRTGIDINNSNGHNVHDNVITDNRTGLIFRNTTDSMTVRNNDITDNWTLGIVFLDGSGGTNAPVQSAHNSTFSGNDISGNWYGGVVDRQQGGSLPAPGTTNLKDFSGNWWGSDAPAFTSVDSMEPGYAAQIPTEFGGTATKPASQPDIAGPASANIDFTPFLWTGSDTNPAIGFQGDSSELGVTTQGAQTQASQRIQEGVDDVTPGGTVHVLSGTYHDDVNITKSLTLYGAQHGVSWGSRTPQGPDESTVVGAADGQAPISVNATDVTVDGFSVTDNRTAFAAFGITVHSTGSHATVVNNIVDGIRTTDAGANGTSQGIYLENGPDQVVVENNLVQNISSVRSAKGIAIGDSSAGSASSNVQLLYNAIQAVDSSTKGAYGIQLNNAQGAPFLSITGQSISNLTSHAGGWIHAIGIEAPAMNLSVTQSSISGLHPGTADSVGVLFESPSSDSGSNSAHVRYNNLDVGAASAGIANQTPSTVDGTCNWWGATNGPSGAGAGSGSPVSSRVTYNPWATAATATPADCNGTPAKATVTSVVVTPQYSKAGGSWHIATSATDPIGLTAVYYNLFDAGTHAFVCTLAIHSIAGNPMSASDTADVGPLPLAGYSVPGGIPCPAGGIADGSYVVAANWENSLGVYDGDPDNTSYGNYPPSAISNTVVYDSVAPAASPSAAPPANGNGWNNTDVTVTWNWTDATSGFDTSGGNCPASSTTSGEGTITLNATCTDLAGNTGTASYTVKVDKTAPTVAPTVTPNPVPYGGPATANPNASDPGGSGVASQSCGPLLLTTPGTHTVSCSATDKAGNTGSGSTTYVVAMPLGSGNTTCNGIYSGNGTGNLTVPNGAVCTLLAGSSVTGNVQVQQGGALNDLGATIGGNLQADHAKYVDISGGGTIKGNLQVQQTTSVPPAPATTNSLCNTTVGNDVQVQNNGAGAPVDIGNVGDCAGNPGLTVGGNLQVQNNAGRVRVGGNTVKNNIQVNNNTGGGSLTSNASTNGNCQKGGNTPAVPGSGNTVTAGHTNTCNL